MGNRDGAPLKLKRQHARLRVTFGILLGALLAIGGVPATAGAESPYLGHAIAQDGLGPAPGWIGYRSMVAFNLGLGSAIGNIGATAALWPLSFLGTEVGVGGGLTGTQFSLMEKIGLGGAASIIRFVGGAGVAYATGSSRAPGGSVWLNVDAAGLEIRSNSHATFFLAAGFTVGLAGGGIKGLGKDCSPLPECAMSNLPGKIYPQARAGIGRWF